MPSPRAVLVCLAEGYGNLVFALPMLTALGELGCAVDLLCECNHTDAHELAALHPAVESAVSGRSQLPRALGEYDAVVHSVWHRTPLGHAREIVAEPLDLRWMHEATANFTAAQKLGYQGRLPEAGFAHLRDAATRSDEIVLIDPVAGPTWERRRYPHMPRVAQLLLEVGASVSLIGSAADAASWTGYPDAERRILPGCITEAAQALARAALVVGQDSGLLQIASAMETPVLGLFGPTSETKNRPLGGTMRLLMPGLPCRPCQMTARWEACADPHCLEHLSPETVTEVAQEMCG